MTGPMRDTRPHSDPFTPLTWGERDGHRQRATTGHQVTAIKVNGGWRFVAWPPTGQHLGAYDTAVKARAACAQHATLTPGATA